MDPTVGDGWVDPAQLTLCSDLRATYRLQLGPDLGFREARGSADDRAWAERAYYRLFRDDVRSSAAARVLDQALDLVRATLGGRSDTDS